MQTLSRWWIRAPSRPRRPSSGQTVSAISRALGQLERKLDAHPAAADHPAPGADRRRQTIPGRRPPHRRIRRRAWKSRLAVRRHVPAGLLRINAASPFMLHVVVPLIGGFREQYPEIALELHTSDQIIDLLEQRTDIAIRIGPLRDSTLHAAAAGQPRAAYPGQPGLPGRTRQAPQPGRPGASQPAGLHPAGNT